MRESWLRVLVQLGAHTHRPGGGCRSRGRSHVREGGEGEGVGQPGVPTVVLQGTIAVRAGGRTCHTSGASWVPMGSLSTMLLPCSSAPMR
jgi:hypothetical protein